MTQLSDKEKVILLNDAELKIVRKIQEAFAPLLLWDIPQFSTERKEEDNGDDDRLVKVILEASADELIRWGDPEASDFVVDEVCNRWIADTEHRKAEERE